MNRPFEMIKEEFFALLPPTIYFFITLALVAVLRVLMLKGTGIPVSTPIQVAIGALILGKAVLIADMLPAVNRYPDKPLAYNIVWKTVIYFAAALVLHYLERLVDFWKETGGFVSGKKKAAYGNGVAPFLGHPDRIVCADLRLRRDARSCARNWTEKGARPILRSVGGCRCLIGGGPRSCSCSASMAMDVCFVAIWATTTTVCNGPAPVLDISRQRSFA
jgi:hypothetical protein